MIGANFDLSLLGEGGTALNILSVAPNAGLIAPPQMEDDRVGYVVFFPDPLDQKIRRICYTVTGLQLAQQLPREGEKPYESLAARAVEKLGRGQDVPRDLQAHAIRFSAPDTFPPRPLYEVFDPKFWHANYADGVFFKDKVVIVGSSAQVAHDVFPTPRSPKIIAC